jgi:hypothetical protein
MVVYGSKMEGGRSILTNINIEKYSHTYINLLIDAGTIFKEEICCPCMPEKRSAVQRCPEALLNKSNLTHTYLITSVWVSVLLAQKSFSFSSLAINGSFM